MSAIINLKYFFVLKNVAGGKENDVHFLKRLGLAECGP